MNMKGETIIEVVVALGAGIVILTALTLMMLRSLNNATEGSSRTLATQYAQEGVETVVKMKDSNWSTLSNLPSNTYCLASSCSSLISTAGSCGVKVSTCGANIGTNFIREIVISQDDPKCVPPNPLSGRKFIRAVANVSYRDSNCGGSNPYCHTISVESCVTNDDKRALP